MATHCRYKQFAIVNAVIQAKAVLNFKTTHGRKRKLEIFKDYFSIYINLDLYPVCLFSVNNLQYKQWWGTFCVPDTGSHGCGMTQVCRETQDMIWVRFQVSERQWQSTGAVRFPWGNRRTHHWGTSRTWALRHEQKFANQVSGEEQLWGKTEHIPVMVRDLTWGSVGYIWNSDTTCWLEKKKA